MGDYLLGLDAGNTVIKAVIFDLDGRELAYAAREGHSRMPKPGHVERDLDEFWDNAQVVIRACIAGDRETHGHRFRSSGRFIQQRGIRQRQTGQVRHHGLEVHEGL